MMKITALAEQLKKKTNFKKMRLDNYDHIIGLEEKRFMILHSHTAPKLPLKILVCLWIVFRCVIHLTSTLIQPHD